MQKLTTIVILLAKKAALSDWRVGGKRAKLWIMKSTAINLGFILLGLLLWSLPASYFLSVGPPILGMRFSFSGLMTNSLSTLLSTTLCIGALGAGVGFVFNPIKELFTSLNVILKKNPPPNWFCTKRQKSNYGSKPVIHPPPIFPSQTDSPVYSPR